MSEKKSALMDEIRPHLVVLVNPDWFFLSHFLERALAAKHAGYDVTVLTTDTGSAQRIVELGLQFVPITMSRHGLGPLGQISTFGQLLRVYRRLKPDLVWHIGLKPIVFGTLAARFAGVHRIVNAPVGMGFVFAGDSIKARILRPFVFWALKRLLNPLQSKVVFENSDDLRDLVRAGAVRREDAVLIRGAGVNVEQYVPTPEQDEIPVVLFAARLIWEKGVGVFVEAARRLRKQGVQARFMIAGGVDQESSSAVPEAQLRGWEAEGVITWLGARKDMVQVLGNCDVFCLPTYYREGLPKVLLEAMACGRACVATDAPGCREAVHHGDNGLLVPIREAEALASALRCLIENAQLRRGMGERGRERALTEFAQEKVIAETLTVFESCRTGRPLPAFDANAHRSRGGMALKSDDLPRNVN